MKRIVFIGLVITAIITISGLNISHSAEAERNSFAVGTKIADEKIITSCKSFSLADNVMENEIVCNNMSFDRQSIGYLVTIDMAHSKNGAKLVACYSDCDGAKYELSTVSDQADDYENSHSGEHVLAGFNADYFDMNTGRPLGALVMDGKVYSKSNNRNFFAILNDGSAVICNSKRIVLNGKKKGQKVSFTSDIQQAVGGQKLLVKNGKITDMAIKDQSGSTGRNIIGIKASGAVVLYTTRGVLAPISYGETYTEAAQKMLHAGCNTVLALDGGGSATSITKRPGDNKLLLRNSPSDGAQRHVSSTLLIVSESSDNNIEENTDTTVHDYVFFPEKCQAVCSICNEVKTDYTGNIKDSYRREYFLGEGRPLTGWRVIGENVYYFDKTGVSRKVIIQDEKKLTCTSNGYRIYYCSSADSNEGKTFKVTASMNAPGHEYDDNYICKVCGWKAVSLDKCNVSIKYKKYSYTGNEIKPYVRIEYKGKQLNSYYDYRMTYEDNTQIGLASVTINPDIRLYVDLRKPRGSILPEDYFRVSFTIIPKSVDNLAAYTAGCSSIKLKWQGNSHIDGYRVYKYNSVSKKYYYYKDTKSQFLIVKNLTPGYVYNFKVNSYTYDSDGKRVYGLSKYAKGITVPFKVEYVKARAVNKAVYLNWRKRNCTGYQVKYSTNSSFNSYRTILVKGSNNINRKISCLKSGRKYYFKVRAYSSSAGCRTVYGNWSAVRSVVVK